MSSSKAVLLAMGTIAVAAGAWSAPPPGPRPGAQELYGGTMRPDDVVWRLAHSDELFPVSRWRRPRTCGRCLPPPEG